MVGNTPNANLMAELSAKRGKKCIGCPPTFSSCHSNPWFIPPVLKTDSRRLFWTVTAFWSPLEQHVVGRASAPNTRYTGS